MANGSKMHRSIGVPGKIIAFISALTLTAGLVAMAPASAHAALGGESKTPGFWIVITSGETFAQAVSQVPRNSRVQAQSTIRWMLRSAEAGHRIIIPEGTPNSVVSVSASRSGLAAALATTEHKRPAAKYSAHDRSPAVSPSAFPVRGAACGNNRAWCNLTLEVAGAFCGPSGCTQTDKITARLTNNPGATGSMTSWTSIYSPYDGNFTGVHFEWFTMMWESQTLCESGNTTSGTGNGSGKFFPACSGTLYHSRITHGFTLWADFLPTAQEFGDSAKTGTAYCASAPDTYCTY